MANGTHLFLLTCKNKFRLKLEGKENRKKKWQGDERSLISERKILKIIMLNYRSI